MSPKADASTLEPLIIQETADLLQARGYFTDEQGLISSFVMEKDLEGIEERVRLAGYQGGELKLLGHTRADHTAVYIVFDPEHVSCDEAAKARLMVKLTRWRGASRSASFLWAGPTWDTFYADDAFAADDVDGSNNDLAFVVLPAKGRSTKRF